MRSAVLKTNLTVDYKTLNYWPNVVMSEEKHRVTHSKRHSTVAVSAGAL